jgi:arsenite methyltransferase
MFKRSFFTTWLSRGSTLCSIIACYGTLAAIAVLGLLGFSITLNESLWAGSIILFALVSVLGLSISLRVHHNLSPLLIGCLGTGLIAYVMTIEYHLTIEIFGFVILCSAVLWDWKIQRRLKA